MQIPPQPIALPLRRGRRAGSVPSAPTRALRAHRHAKHGPVGYSFLKMHVDAPQQSFKEVVVAVPLKDIADLHRAIAAQATPAPFADYESGCAAHMRCCFSGPAPKTSAEWHMALLGTRMAGRWFAWTLPDAQAAAPAAPAPPESQTAVPHLLPGAASAAELQALLHRHLGGTQWHWTGRHRAVAFAVRGTDDGWHCAESAAAAGPAEGSDVCAAEGREAAGDGAGQAGTLRVVVHGVRVEAGSALRLRRSMACVPLGPDRADRLMREWLAQFVDLF